MTANRPAEFDAAILDLLPAARAFIDRREFNAHRREDILQGAVERALTNWERYPGTYSLKTWFFWQIRRVIEREISASQRNPGTTEAMVDMPDDRPSAEDYAASIAHAVPPHRLGLVMDLVAGKTLREIAAGEGLRHQAIASRMDTVRHKVREAMDAAA